MNSSIGSQSASNIQIREIPSVVFEVECKKHIEFFHITGENKRFVRCKTCITNPNLLKIFGKNNKPPPIATEKGTKYRKSVVDEHFQTKYHKESKKCQILSTSSFQKGRMDFHINQANKALANHLGKLLIQVYNDAKKLTLSAFSWPSRYVASEAGNQFNFDDSTNSTIPTNINLQYINRPSHLELLSCIVKSDDQFTEKIKSSLACSIRTDGSVDKYHIDKIYVMLKIITKYGIPELLLLGIADQTERKAAGLLNAVKRAISTNMSDDDYKTIMRKISSICTDGTNLNSGDTAGLWKLFEDEIKAEGSLPSLIKIWCSAHRLELVWDDVCDDHQKVNELLSTLSSIASYFNKSAMRLKELKDISSENDAILLSLPKLFEIRWTEFSHTLVNNVLKSWQTLVAYFTKVKNLCAQASGFLAYMTNEDNIRMIAFLADVLQVFQRCQKKLQSNDLTFISLVNNLNLLRKSVSNLKDTQLLGGWEAAVYESLTHEDN